MKRRIVLIVGAGASNALHPQFSLGAGLLQQISDRVTDRTSIHHPYLSNLLDKLGFDYSVRWNFVHHLDHYRENAEFPSIDEFLNEVSAYPEFYNVKEEFTQIGKFAIMFHILGYEAEIKNPTSGGLKDDAWIHLVAKFIDEKVNENLDLKIITFNYDRNIEHFLYNHERFVSKRQVIKSFLDDSLVHVYGKIGNLEWQNSSDNFEFGEDNSKADKIYREKNEIKIQFPERIDGLNSESDRARRWIHSQTTEKVCAFGFNFDLMNYRTLALQNIGIASNIVKFIANVYPHGDSNFRHRRTMANRIRNIKHEVEITYKSCCDFIDYVLFPYH